MKMISAMLALLLWLSGHGVLAAPPPGTAYSTSLAPAAGRFLVAQRGLRGEYFGHTVVYLLQHDASGSVGVIVNRPLGMKVAEVLPDTEHEDIGASPVYSGGPVNRRIMVMLFRGNYPTELALHVDADIYASSNTAILARMMSEHKPAHELRMYAGQAGWAPGQLASELEHGSWFVTEGDPDMLFAPDAGDLWNRLIEQLDPPGILVLEQDRPAARL
ncbi:MAG: YqgE/AlgH family protein [Pseudomonadota bacterium]